MARPLTPKQERFCEEYLIDCNGTQAAIRAGYAKANADKQASQLIGNTRVAAYLAKLMGAQSKRVLVTADEVVGELKKLGFANLQDYVRVTDDGDPFIDLTDLTSDQFAALSEATIDDYVEGRGKNARVVRKVKIKLHDKVRSLDSLAKHLGLFGPGGRPEDPIHTVNITISRSVES